MKHIGKPRPALPRSKSRDFMMYQSFGRGWWTPKSLQTVGITGMEVLGVKLLQKLRAVATRLLVAGQKSELAKAAGRGG